MRLKVFVSGAEASTIEEKRGVKEGMGATRHITEDITIQWHDTGARLQQRQFRQ